MVDLASSQNMSRAKPPRRTITVADSHWMLFCYWFGVLHRILCFAICETKHNQKARCLQKSPIKGGQYHLRDLRFLFWQQARVQIVKCGSGGALVRRIKRDMLVCEVLQSRDVRDRPDKQPKQAASKNDTSNNPRG